MRFNKWLSLLNIDLVSFFIFKNYIILIKVYVTSNILLYINKNLYNILTGLKINKEKLQWHILYPGTILQNWKILLFTLSIAATMTLNNILILLYFDVERTYCLVTIKDEEFTKITLHYPSSLTSQVHWWLWQIIISKIRSPIPHLTMWCWSLLSSRCGMLVPPAWISYSCKTAEVMLFDFQGQVIKNQ